MKDPEYVVADPTGNITVLVTNEYSPEERPVLSEKLCRDIPDCEQVGFITNGTDGADICLNMAGGEFCGNATMSAAAFFATGKGIEQDREISVSVRTSGTRDLVKVNIRRTGENKYDGSVTMPVPFSADPVKLMYNGKTYDIAVVKFEGMYHAIIEESDLTKEDAEKAVVKWAQDLGAKGMGIMFVDEERMTLTPIVYVPALGEFYWEHACASGTTATGYYFYKKYSKPVKMEFKEPGGTLGISVDEKGIPVLSGTVSFRE